MLSEISSGAIKKKRNKTKQKQTKKKRERDFFFKLILP